MSNNVVWFQDVGMADVPVVGGKNASLGEMVRTLTDAGVRVPDGFATTADAYRGFVAHNELQPRIDAALEEYHAGRATLRTTGETIREAFLAGTFPSGLCSELIADYHELEQRSGVDRLAVAVRSSATAEDLPDASFAGQQETFLNVVGERELLDACRRCYASLFTDRAISYREVKGFDHTQVALSIGVQRMVRSDVGGSGVMFSLDTESGFPRVVVISAAWGLGETVVQGEVDPDKYLVFKPLLDDPRLMPIIEKTVGAKAVKMVYGQGGQRAHQAGRDDRARAARLRAERRRGRAARPLGGARRAALRPPDGHGMGQGRRHRRAVPRAGPPRDGPGAQGRHRVHRQQAHRCG